MRKLLVVVTLMVLLGTACSGSDSGGDTASGGAGLSGNAEEMAVEEESGRAGFAADQDGSAGTGAGGGSLAGGSAATIGERSSSLPDLQASVIKTGDLTVTVPDDGIAGAVTEATTVAETYGGYVVQTSMQEAGDRSASVTIRVPSQEFEASIADLRAIGEVRSESVEGRDVSEEFIDLEARLRNLVSQEAVLLRLYERASSVVDTIRIQREVEDVQLEIERHRGRLRYLRDRTSLSTITVNFVGPDAIAKTEKDDQSVIGKAWDQAKDVALAMVSAVIVSSGAVLPLALFALILFGLFKILRPRLGA